MGVGVGARQRRRPHAQGSAQGSWVKRVGVRAWFELHSITASFRDVRRLPLGEGREWQALQRINRAPVLDADERARVLERVGVVVQIRMQSRNRLMGHAARLARHRGVLRVRHLHVVVLGRLGAPRVHLRLRHEDLAVLPALETVVGCEPSASRANARCQREGAQRAWRARATAAAGRRPPGSRAAAAARTTPAARAPRPPRAPRATVARSRVALRAHRLSEVRLDARTPMPPEVPMSKPAPAHAWPRGRVAAWQRARAGVRECGSAGVRER